MSTNYDDEEKKKSPQQDLSDGASTARNMMETVQVHQFLEQTETLIRHPIIWRIHNLPLLQTEVVQVLQQERAVVRLLALVELLRGLEPQQGPAVVSLRGLEAELLLDL